MKLGLGTAQFGLDYGATNRAGRVPEDEVAAMLASAAQEGIGVLDTAAVYGIAEAVLGRCMARPVPFAIVTKTAPAADPASVAAGFAASLQRLGVTGVWGLLSHRAQDLLADSQGATLAHWLLEQRDNGRAIKVGVSVYTPEEADLVFARYPFDLVQLPLNVLDQRFLATGALDRLLARGVEIHIRSAFLQGILLEDPASLPARLAPLSPLLRSYRDTMARHGISPLAAALAFAAKTCPSATVICGATGSRELAQILEASRLPAGILPDLSAFACNDDRLIDPRSWTS